jgi:hypothetical protein
MSDDQDPEDIHRFEAALDGGVDFLMKSFGSHGFRCDDFFDQEEFKEKLKNNLEPLMREAFPVPEAVPSPRR